LRRLDAGYKSCVDDVSFCRLPFGGGNPSASGRCVYVLHKAARSDIIVPSMATVDRATSVADAKGLFYLKTTPIHQRLSKSKMYTVSQKNKTLNYSPQLPQMLTDFQSVYACLRSGQFCNKSYINISSHLNRVATLPCEISMFRISQCSMSN